MENFVLLRGNFVLLTPNKALLKFMVCVLDFQIQIYVSAYTLFLNDISIVHCTWQSPLLIVFIFDFGFSVLNLITLTLASMLFLNATLKHTLPATPSNHTFDHTQLIRPLGIALLAIFLWNLLCLNKSHVIWN